MFLKHRNQPAFIFGAAYERQLHGRKEGDSCFTLQVVLKAEASTLSSLSPWKYRSSFIGKSVHMNKMSLRWEPWFDQCNYVRFQPAQMPAPSQQKIRSVDWSKSASGLFAGRAWSFNEVELHIVPSLSQWKNNFWTQRIIILRGV